MNTNIIQGNWNEVKGKIKSQWAKLTDNDLKEVEGNIEKLAGKIQKAYGYKKEKAEQEFDEFKRKLNLEAGKADKTDKSSSDKFSGSEKSFRK